MTEAVPVVIKMHPDRDEYEEAETAFFYTLGNCVNRWAFVDRQLFRLCRFALSLDDRQTAIVFYRDTAFTRRLLFVESALKTILSKSIFENQWRPLRIRAVDLAQTRNIFVHHPAKRLGTSEDGKAVYIYSIHIEPYMRLLNRDIPGLQGKDELRLDDLEQHLVAVEKLENDLGDFRRELIVSARKGEQATS